MLTNAFYAALASGLRPGAGGQPTLYVAIGGGEAAWDRSPPLLLRGIGRLANELARLPVTAEGMHYLDEEGAETDTPAPRLRLRVRFAPGIGTGPLREVGLFGGAAQGADSGTLLSYFVHAPIHKTAEMELERVITLDLTPRGTGGNVTPTRYLGNSKSREVHDLAHRTAACQVEEILFDRRLFFGSPEQALELGYDCCAYCFGRARSGR